MIVFISLFSPMFRPFPPTPSVLFPHGQRDWSAVSDSFSELPGPTIAGPAHSDKGEYVSGHVAKRAHLTRSSDAQMRLPQVLSIGDAKS